MQMIRETLWWLRVPGSTELKTYPLTPKDESTDTNPDEFRLALTDEPAVKASRFLQLATAKVARWQFPGDKPGHRIDRVPFSSMQREGIRRILTELDASDATKGWATLSAGDGGNMKVYIKHLKDSDDFNTLNILIDVLTFGSSALVHRFMQECGFMLWPMAFAPNMEIARSIDCDWPEVEVVESPAALHEILACGPHRWWRRI